MSETWDGGCQCGKVRYRITGPPLDLTICHCRDCQRQSGSAFGMSLFVPVGAFQLLGGEPKSFSVMCDSGRIKVCMFCGDCGTRICHQTNGAVVSVKAGTLDDTLHFVPTAHYWTRRKQSWVTIPDGVKCFADDG